MPRPFRIPDTVKTFERPVYVPDPENPEHWIQQGTETVEAVRLYIVELGAQRFYFYPQTGPHDFTFEEDFERGPHVGHVYKIIPQTGEIRYADHVKRHERYVYGNEFGAWQAAGALVPEGPP